MFLSGHTKNAKTVLSVFIELFKKALPCHRLVGPKCHLQFIWLMYRKYHSDDETNYHQ